MKARGFLFALIAILVADSDLIGQPAWQQVWADEFSGPSIDRSNWTYDIGGGGWGNNELQYYTDRAENSRIENGLLIIEARKEKLRNREFTSARLKTQGLHSWTYGRVEARIQVPNGQGVWPAFWMLGANFPDVGWPACGELDIMEHVSPIGPNTIRGSAHGPDYSGANSVHGDAVLGDLSGAFHVFAVEWEPGEVRWYVDGVKYFSVTPPLPGPWVFDHPFFIILNLAIGGEWPGPPDASTIFPARMLVDYVRVYRDANQPPPPELPLKVSALEMSTALNGPNWQAIAAVTVTDGNGVLQSGVTVHGAWSGLIGVGVTEAITGSNGVAVLSSGRVRQAGTINFCVTDLTKDGYAYVPSGGGDCGQATR